MAKIYETELREVKVFSKAICDRCKKSIDDDMELQEMHFISFTGGYSSVFGDMNEVSCDLCQQCLKDLIGHFCVYNGGE